MIHRLSFCLLIYSLLATQSFAADSSRQVVFPDTPPTTGQIQLRAQFIKLREDMENASKTGRSLTKAEGDQIRAALMQLASGAPDDPVATYAQRRLILLDWQIGKLSTQEVADRLSEFAAQQEGTDRYFSQAMSLTFELRAHQFERFCQEYPSLRPEKVTQFGWFVNQYTGGILKWYIQESVTPDEAASGKPIPEEYRRKVEVADFLEEEYFPSLDAYLSQYKSRLSQAKGDDWLHSADAKMERANIVIAMSALTQYIRRYLGGRLYLDVSERATDVLLPRSLELWESAVDLIQDDRDGLESPDHHRNEIKTFRESIVPHLKELQKGQHLKREFGKVIAAQEGKIENLDRETLERLAAEQKAASETAPATSSSTTTARNLVVILNVAVICALVVVAYVKRKRKLAATREGSSE